MYVGVWVCDCVGVLLVNREKKWEKNVNEKIFLEGEILRSDECMNFFLIVEVNKEYKVNWIMRNTQWTGVIKMTFYEWSLRYGRRCQIFSIVTDILMFVFSEIKNNLIFFFVFVCTLCM